MTKKELKSKLIDIIDKKQRLYAELQDQELCRQVEQVKYEIGVELVAFNAVLDALNNNHAMINCY